MQGSRALPSALPPMKTGRRRAPVGVGRKGWPPASSCCASWAPTSTSGGSQACPRAERAPCTDQPLPRQGDTGTGESSHQPATLRRRGVEEVWKGSGGGVEGLPCGSCNYLILLSLQRRDCDLQVYLFDRLERPAPLRLLLGGNGSLRSHLTGRSY